jgi:hypothetical protein
MCVGLMMMMLGMARRETSETEERRCDVRGVDDDDARYGTAA